MAAHYHVGAMHPFDDGNGRTARALEAFMLRRAGVNDMVMVSLSNYYYEHMEEYLAALYDSRSLGHDLTPFLRIALPAVAERCNALAAEIVHPQQEGALPRVRPITVRTAAQPPTPGAGGPAA